MSKADVDEAVRVQEAANRLDAHVRGGRFLRIFLALVVAQVLTLLAVSFMLLRTS